MSIYGGNKLADRPYADGWYNFYMVDTNNPIDGDGEINKWEIWAENTLPVQLYIYRNEGSWEVVGKSAVETPTKPGHNQWTIADPIKVKKGDLVGFYYPKRGSVSFQLNDGIWWRRNETGSVVFTGIGNGPTQWVGSSSRVYSIRVSGTSAQNVVNRPGVNVAMPCTNLGQAIQVKQGQLVHVIATAQSSGVQSAKIVDPHGNVVFEASGKSSSGGAFTLLKQGTFTAQETGTYVLHMTPNAGVIGSGSNAIYGGSTLLRTFGFGSNDGGCEAGDRDFNDLHVGITIFGRRG